MEQEITKMLTILHEVYRGTFIVVCMLLVVLALQIILG
jgi:hypothetical protein